jgi:hypothetical protein
MFSLLLSVLVKVCSIKIEPTSVPLWTKEELESFVTLWLAIFVKWYFMSVMSTTCILQHVVVCWVTTVGIRAKALTLGWTPS